MSMSSDSRMNAIVAARFSLIIFFVVHVFPNDVSIMDEWEIFIPIFRYDKDHNPTENFFMFHELMYQFRILHEDVLMKNSLCIPLT